VGQEVVYLGLGSNIGDKVDNCLRALNGIDASSHTHIRALSSLYKTEPVGYRDQDWFINAVVEVITTLAPQFLHEFLQGMEKQMGRTKTWKMGPRVIDLDILFYGTTILEAKDLIIPHPHLHERGFVLVPLAEIAPDLFHPVLKKTVSELLNTSGKEGVELYAAVPNMMEVLP
jgi:2-amino-4-hydroxy-6-hydroxymethyldihydropteridine diphosphokinase